MRRPIMIAIAALSLAAGTRPAAAASLSGLQVFSEREYARIVFSLDSEARATVEPQSSGELVLVRFDGTDITRLPDQSYVFDNNPHVESVTFLPQNGGATIARIKARHPFSLKTYSIGQPPRFVLEISDSANKIGEKNASGGIDYYSRGLEQVSQHSDEAALISFRNAIRAGRQAPESYYQAGLIRLRQNQPQMAEVNFEKSIGSDQYAHESRMFLAWLAHLRGDRESFRRRWNGFSAAVPDPARRLELAATHPEVDYRAMEQAARDAGLTAVTVAMHSEAPAEAVPAVKSAMTDSPVTGSRLNPDSARTFFDLGMQARRENRYEQAAAYFHQSLTYNPSNAEACFQLGIVYKEMGRLTESATWFEKSLGNTANAGSSQAEPIEVRPQLEAGPLSGVNAPLNPDLDEDMLPDSSGLPSVGIQTGTDGTIPPDGVKKAQESAVALQAGALGGEVPAELKSMNLIQRLRKAVSTFVEHTGMPLLRKQVAILTAITGVLFLLTLIGERLATGKTGLRLFGYGRAKDETKISGAVPSAETAISLRQAAESVERRRQVAQVLARELASKQKAIPAVSPNAETSPAALSRGLDLRVGRPASGPVYGADIARRIKEQLASPSVQAEAMAAGFARSRDDVKARLIRQLRAKNWTVSDIAQEMGLSREEVKWALSSGQTERAVERRPSLDEFSQARELAARARAGETAPVSERDLDREMEMELQINV